MGFLAKFNQSEELEKLGWEKDPIKGEGMCWAYSLLWILMHEAGGYQCDEKAANGRMQSLREVPEKVGKVFESYSRKVEITKERDYDVLKGNMVIVASFAEELGVGFDTSTGFGESHTFDLSSSGLRKIFNHMFRVHTYRLLIVNRKGGGHAMATYHKGGENDRCHFFDPNVGEMEGSEAAVTEYLKGYFNNPFGSGPASCIVSIAILGANHVPIPRMTNTNAPSRSRAMATPDPVLRPRGNNAFAPPQMLRTLVRRSVGG